MLSCTLSVCILRVMFRNFANFKYFIHIILYVFIKQKDGLQTGICLCLLKENSFSQIYTNINYKVIHDILLQYVFFSAKSSVKK